MAINFFKTLNEVLTQGIAGICRSYRISEEEAIERAKDYLRQNSSAYYSGNAPNIEYNDPICRIAYLYAYVAAHANLIDNSFYKFPELKEKVLSVVNSNGVLKVCSLGGGPGSELLGFVKFIDRERAADTRVDIDFTLIDKVQHWDESWHALVGGLEATFNDMYGPSRRDWPIVIHRSFLPLDLEQADQLRHYPDRFTDIDIFVLNYTVSELMFSGEQFLHTFKVIVEVAPSGALFLVIDRNEQSVKEYVDALMNDDRLITLGYTEEKTNMDEDEQKENLGDWYRLMGREPKLTWDAFYYLAQKV